MPSDANVAFTERLAAADMRVRQQYSTITRREQSLSRPPNTGVSYGGLTLAHPKEKTQEDILDEAERVVAGQRAWEATPDGQLFGHLTVIERCALAILETLEMVKSARNRGFQEASNRTAAVARLEEITAASERTRTAARLAIDFAAAMPATIPQAAE